MNVNRPVIPKDNNMDELTRSILGGTAITASTSSLSVKVYFLFLFYLILLFNLKIEIN